VLQPLIATPASRGTYTIIAGERRWRAAKLAGLKTVPVIVRTSEELEQLEIALVENVQRVDLSPLEQAASIERLHQQFNLSYEIIARRLGKGNSTVTRGHPEAQGELLKLIIRHGWSVRQAEQFVTTHNKAGIHDSHAAQKRMRAETPETKRLGKRLSSAVSIRRTAHGGKLEIDFRSDDDLDRLLKTLLA
jgi:ParB family chromosome partitioning protein